ncbi:MAG: Rieske (2Fe-2S) protein [Candidatus Kapabacteria bacterium]|nr:Rieske (2Fe-2S) protein [Candidatus Kapabacteria bacterium]
MDSELEQRRNFLKNSGKIIVGAACYSTMSAILTSCESYTELVTPSQGIDKIVNIDTDLTFPKPLTQALFEKKGFGAQIRFPDVNYGIPLILVRIDDNTIACYSSLCSHANCFGDELSIPKGYYESDSLKGYRLITCGCHGSQFDPFQNGKAVTGPAEKSLKRYPTEFDKETRLLTIKF